MQFLKFPLLILIVVGVVGGISYGTYRTTMTRKSSQSNVAIVAGRKIAIPAGWGVIVTPSKSGEHVFGRISAISPHRPELTTDVFGISVTERMSCDHKQIVERLMRVFPDASPPFGKVESLTNDGREIGYTWVEPGLVEGDRYWCIPLGDAYTVNLSVPLVDTETLHLVEEIVIPQFLE